MWRGECAHHEEEQQEAQQKTGDRGRISAHSSAISRSGTCKGGWRSDHGEQAGMGMQSRSWPDLEGSRFFFDDVVIDTSVVVQWICASLLGAPLRGKPLGREL